MSRGLDCDSDCTAAAGCIKGAGYGWVGRYLVPEKAEPLTEGEAQVLSTAGLYIVSIWEWGFPTSVGYFSEAQGRRDGAGAFAYARLIGQPQGTPIYFCVDYDATQAQIEGPIAEYFQGVRAAFAQLGYENDPSSVYYCGVYGNGLACEWLLAVGLVHFTWLSMSRGWGGADFEDYNLHQTGQELVCGVGVDADQSAAKGGGGWKLPIS